MKKLIILVVFLFSVVGCVTIEIKPYVPEKCEVTLSDKEKLELL